MHDGSAPLTIVHAVFSSHIAGGERHCADLANAQARLGHRVHVVGKKGSPVALALAAEVRFHGMTLPVLRGRRLARLAESLHADVCHAHLGPACKATAFVRTAVRIGTLHVGYKPRQHADLDGLICVNRAQHQGLPSRRRALVRVIYNWAPDREPMAVPDTSLRVELGLAPEQLLIGSIGRLHPSKGMDVLIEAFRAHAPADAVLVILGEGREQERLARMAAGDHRVRLLGYRGDVDRCLASFDLFVSPSREDAFPLAILEAMRAGRPILSTATQGPLEMLDGQPARICAIGDSGALGQALKEELARLGPLPRQERQACYEIQAYERASTIRKVIGFYRDVLELSPRSKLG